MVYKATHIKKYPQFKPRRKALRSALNRALLELVHMAGDAITDYSIFLSYQRAALRHGMSYARELSAIQSAHELKRRVAELKRQQLIQARQIGEHIIWKLTNDGLLLAQLNRLQQIPNKGSISTLIFFDIPEIERRTRKQIRLVLRQIGFKKFQQSVWVRQADVYQEAKKLIAVLKADRWVTVLRTGDI